MNVSFDFGGKTALVTGAGSGIGRASAIAFAAAGANVAVADISEKGGNETVSAIQDAGGTAEFFRVDVADEAAVQALVASVAQRFGGIDFAHNNAGIEGNVVPLAELPSDNWRRVIDVNLSSVFYCLKAEIPHMVARGGGAIVNTASISGLIGGYSLSVYTAAKHGVVGLTKAAAMDYAEKGMRINSLCPGLIETPFIHELPKPALDHLLNGTPMGRMGQPAEMAQVVMWLCSDSASYVTGHAMVADGAASLGGMATRIGHLINPA